MSDLKPIAHLVWGQYRRAADDVEDYYEVAYRPDHKSVDGSDPFPVWDCPPDVASLTAERDRLREENERLRNCLETITGIHGTNPSLPYADAPEADYLKHVLWEVRQLAREALKGDE